MAQLEPPVAKGCWGLQVMDDLKQLTIQLEFEEIAKMSKEKFKNIVKIKINNLR